ncbi:pyridoxamine 5'-phosphate oxidase family protein [Actinacidiphila bryophytorum]|uniref:Pyridoxamine 5'-phosphate oxidase n=1 Tax=Actinacidiphila bryophytorum TaxID=1436133 RepID=A0A9W4MC00_9ACTN|nr:pyridoxamine 5'-phosphate oxidase family protein [Actinacidiphila bryophytorum]MBM9438128.1 pyridoxamine 5'-phosphate oxidase family protein [Actinacidiphila bryophytorum]MBN6545488.1 pyridoxamine 5'-phosphate oxidase family protein [Actinacidiphila bryophytorum]CAG7647493.1 Pyridoxamine 5'-phosphate oxidase [Actinacidiphila bryophytorum]
MSVPTPEQTAALPQGDVALLHSQVAQRLLASRELARVAYVAADGTPRVFPMLFHWNGEEVVLSTFHPARKIAALRARPDVALTVDAATAPPQALLIRGRAEVTDVEGIAPDYRSALRRYAGSDEAGDAQAAAVDGPGVRMARIAVRPLWVGVLDFTTRFPGGSSAAEFDARGRRD